MTKDEALKRAIEALNLINNHAFRCGIAYDAIKACKEALKPHPDCDEACMFQCQMERKEALVELQEPEYVYVNPITQDMYYLTKTTQPAQKEWVGLSDSDVMEITWDLEDTDDLDIFTSDFARAIEAKLKELNT